MANIVWMILSLYSFIVIARVLLSYFPTIDYNNPLVRLVYDLTEPVLQPIRQFLRQQFPNMGPFDFSPLVLLIGIWIFQRIVFALL